MRNRSHVHELMADPEEACKNLIELLKTINLATIGVSVALISNVLLSRSAATHAENEELQSIAILQKVHGFESPASLVDGIGLPGETRTVPGIMCRFTIVSSRFSTPVILDADVPNAGLPDRSFPPLLISTPLRDIHTIKHFKGWWNEYCGLRRLLLLHLPPLEARVIWHDDKGTTTTEQVGITVERVRAEKEVPLSPEKSKDAVLDADSIWVSYYLPNRYSPLGPHLPWKGDAPEYSPELTLHFKMDQIGLNLPQDLGSSTGLRSADNPFYGDFEFDFPALNAIVEKFGAFSFEELRRLMASEDRPKETLEIFGARIPTDLIAKVGVPLLIVLQWQFASVCRFLARAQHPISLSSASRWSFLLNGFGFALVAYGSVSILPVAATLSSLWYVAGVTWYGIGLLGMVGFASALTTMRLSLLRRRVGPALGNGLVDAAASPVNESAKV